MAAPGSAFVALQHAGLRAFFINIVNLPTVKPATRFDDGVRRRYNFDQSESE